MKFAEIDAQKQDRGSRTRKVRGIPLREWLFPRATGTTWLNCREWDEKPEPLYRIVTSFWDAPFNIFVVPFIDVWKDIGKEKHWYIVLPKLVVLPFSALRLIFKNAVRTIRNLSGYQKLFVIIETSLIGLVVVTYMALPERMSLSAFAPPSLLNYQDFARSYSAYYAVLLAIPAVYSLLNLVFRARSETAWFQRYSYYLTLVVFALLAATGLENVVVSSHYAEYVLKTALTAIGLE
ncbi:hypothetical protein [Vibrio neonatus]|uniref:hypothetical protein n=1 Tax=Vibrio neonatus TaxID=278860 RepID=UPI0021C2F3FC|nr:hypothetical protein [Vibrio neonatus]